MTQMFVGMSKLELEARFSFWDFLQDDEFHYLVLQVSATCRDFSCLWVASTSFISRKLHEIFRTQLC